MTTYLVIAKYTEDVSWIPLGDHVVVVYDKSSEYTNIGREAETFARFFAERYDTLTSKDTVWLLQGNPFDHCPDILHRFTRPVTHLEYLGGLHTSDATGKPAHPGLPVGEAHAMLFTETLHKWTFAAGAQYATPGHLVKNKTHDFWKRLHSLLYNEKICAWTMERLWPCVFHLSIPSTSFTNTNPQSTNESIILSNNMPVSSNSISTS